MNIIYEVKEYVLKRIEDYKINSETTMIFGMSI